VDDDLFQILVSTCHPAKTAIRDGAAGMGWSISHISTPLVMGALKDLYGIHAAFYILAPSRCCFRSLFARSTAGRSPAEAALSASAPGRAFPASKSG